MRTDIQLDLGNKPIAAKALALATKHHEGIKRKYCGEPYINHPKRVAEKLLSYGIIDQQALAAALLHDCIEDEDVRGMTMPEHVIADECGDKVLRWVKLLTNTETGNRAQRKAKAALRIAGAPAPVRAIKLADVMDNCKDVADADPGFAEKYIAEKQAFLKGLPSPGTNNTLARMMLDCRELLSEEMNKVAVHHLQAGLAMENLRIADEEELAALIAEEDRSVFANVAMF